MDIQQIIAAMTEGLPADQAATVRAAIERDAVKTKVAGWKQQSEYEQIQTQMADLQRKYDGEPGKPGTGAKDYQEWYVKNQPAIAALQDRVAKYEAKFGSLEAAAQPAAPSSGATVSEADVQRIANDFIQKNYGARWSDLLKQQSKILQKHFLSGRKTEVDVEKLAEVANAKYAGNLELAYDEWDKPERDKAEKAQHEAEISRRVNEELQKRGASANFPAAADFTPSALSSRTKKETDSFDKTQLMRDLAHDWNNPETGKVQ